MDYGFILWNMVFALLILKKKKVFALIVHTKSGSNFLFSSDWKTLGLFSLIMCTLFYIELVN